MAAVIQQNGTQRIISGSDPQTTNNRMEITGVINGLEAIDPSAKILISSDSTYVINTMTKGWKRKANHDLWEQLDRLVRGRDISWRWVRGHSGDPGNELAVMRSSPASFSGWANWPSKYPLVVRVRSSMPSVARNMPSRWGITG